MRGRVAGRDRELLKSVKGRGWEGLRFADLKKYVFVKVTKMYFCYISGLSA